ncbi:MULTISPECIES: dephospho-CoA kinase [Empedobacter]|uniref:Dephospho-CoA kinase n=1 Tax=Empedobacter falsenii TaxID=343874 RepID=A0A376G2B9_9FLAO|nr:MULTISPECIES: dephospho-CoA kinase [Empedobacter]MDH0659593.1 dephospho-CoA kinase [Empedobacter sp. GD03865]STD54111.1 Dephospho-CoA kinase [Empedobacter falsenii]
MKNNQPFVAGITGGIGSGKSTAAKFFEELGIPVYNSDTRAKTIQNENSEVKVKIIAAFGEEAYNENGLNKPYLSKQVFQNNEKLKLLNSIVHPAVFQDFENWKKAQKSDIVMKEAAILIESGSYKDCDVVISVVVDLETRIARTIERDGLSREEILARINNQISDEERIAKSDFIIDNNGDLAHLKNEVEETFIKIKKMI